MPRIALTLSGRDTPEHLAARERYVAALRSAGALVVSLLPGDPAPAEFDGLCLAGGEDVHPSRYGAAAEGSGPIDTDRDALELALLERALRADLPVLGICRGFQLLNVAFGGRLIQHRDGHRPVPGKGGEVVPHEVAAAPGSLLARIVGTAPHTVNSRHHQVVDDRSLAPGLVATARVDGLVEALESPTHRFVLGVQWHPERKAEVAPQATRVFDAFVQAATPVRSR